MAHTLIVMFEPLPDREFPVETLLRWERTGAEWKVLVATVDTVTIGLYRCDGGEEVERFTSTDPDLLGFVAARSAQN